MNYIKKCKTCIKSEELRDNKCNILDVRVCNKWHTKELVNNEDSCNQHDDGITSKYEKLCMKEGIWIHDFYLNYYPKQNDNDGKLIFSYKEKDEDGNNILVEFGSLTLTEIKKIESIFYVLGKSVDYFEIILKNENISS